MANEKVGIEIAESNDGTNALIRQTRELAGNLDTVERSGGRTLKVFRIINTEAKGSANSVNGMSDALGRVGATTSGLSAVGTASNSAAAGLDRMRIAAAANTDYQKSLGQRSAELNKQLNGMSNAAGGAAGALGSTGKVSAETEAIMRKLGLRFKDTAVAMGQTKKAGAELDDMFKGLGIGMNMNTRIFTAFIGVLSAVAGALSVSKYLELADAFTNIQNRIKLFTKNADENNKVMLASLGIANRTYTDWSQVAGIYGKVAGVLKGMHKPAEDTAKVTETIAQAVALSGTSAESAKAGLTQFQQGLSSGVLRGEEFNSVVEQVPGLAKAMADGLGVGISGLRAMAQSGQLTTTKIMDALQKSAPKVAAAFAQVTPTVGQATQAWSNSLTNFVGRLDQATGFSAALARGIIFLSNNMHIVAPVAMTLGAALLIMVAPLVINSVINLATALMARLLPAILANLAAVGAFLLPVAAITLAIAAMAAGAVMLYTGLQTLGQYFPSLSGLIASLSTGFNNIVTNTTALFTRLTSGNVILQTFADLASRLWGNIKQVANDILKWAQNNETLNKILEVASKFVENLYNNIKALWDMAKKFVPGLKDVEDGLKKAYQGFGDASDAGGKFKKTLAETGRAAQEAGADYNQFGEKISDTASRQKDFDKRNEDYIKTLERAGIKTRGLGTDLRGMTMELDKTTTSSWRSSNASDGAAAGFDRMGNSAANAAMKIAQVAGTMAAAQDEFGNYYDSQGNFLSDLEIARQQNNAVFGGGGGSGGGGGGRSGGFDDDNTSGSMTVDAINNSSVGKVVDAYGTQAPNEIGTFTTYIPGPSLEYGGRKIIDYSRTNLLLLDNMGQYENMKSQIEDAQFYLGRLAQLHPDLPPSAIANMFMSGIRTDLRDGPNARNGIGGDQGWGYDSQYDSAISGAIGSIAGGMRGNNGASGGAGSFGGGGGFVDPGGAANDTGGSVVTPATGGDGSSSYGGNRPIQIIINTPDYNSMRRSEKQIARDGFRELIRKVS